MIAAWNVRGLNASLKQRDVFQFLHKTQVGLVGLFETKLTVNKIKHCHAKYFPGWNSLDTCAYHPRCRVWVLWKIDEFEVVDYTLDAAYVHMEVLWRHKQIRFHLTMVYAHNAFADRLVLWDKLARLNANVPAAWLMLGDFNNVLHRDERLGGHEVSETEVAPFRSCLESCALADMRNRGCKFTWSNGTIMSKIDRALVNDSWIQLFPDVETVFRAPQLSDHSPMTVQLDVPPRLTDRSLSILTCGLRRPLTCLLLLAVGRTLCTGLSNLSYLRNLGVCSHSFVLFILVVSLPS